MKLDGAPASSARARRPLFRKYFLVLFAAVVVPLIASGASEAWFGYPPKGSAFRCSSREMVAFARPSARAMAPIDRPAARKTPSSPQPRRGDVFDA